MQLTSSALRELRSLPASARHPIGRRIDQLSNEPRPAGCRKLVGGTDLWRIRSGDYRIIYAIEDQVRIVEIRRISHRRDAY